MGSPFYKAAAMKLNHTESFIIRTTFDGYGYKLVSLNNEILKDFNQVRTNYDAICMFGTLHVLYNVHVL